MATCAGIRTRSDRSATSTAPAVGCWLTTWSKAVSRSPSSITSP